MESGTIATSADLSTAGPVDDGGAELPEPRSIALLAGNLDTEYPRSVIAGVAERLTSAGYATVVYAGGMLGEPSCNHALYRVPDASHCDGLLCLSGLVGQLVDGPTLSAFLARYAPLPAVSVAVAVDCAPSVAIDDESGMYAAVSHLIEHHERRRIAFVRGPESSSEAQRRYRAYRNALADHDLQFDDRLVVQGSWTVASGEAASRALADTWCGEFDAIVGANDNMASAAAKVLRERGIAVPRQVAVVGFDDAEESRFAVPPLTTVRQPLAQLGWKAAQTLIEHMQSSLQTRHAVLAPKLVARDSCGCFLNGVPMVPMRSLPPAASEAPQEPGSSDELLVLLIRDVLEAAGITPRSLPERILSAFASDQAGVTVGALAATLREALAGVSALEASPWELRPLVTLLRRWAFARVPDDTSVRLRAENLLEGAAMLIGARARQSEARRRLVAEARSRMLSQVARSISGTAEMDELAHELQSAMKRLHVRSSNIVLYDGPDRPEEAHLVLRLVPSGLAPLPPGGVGFLARRLLPEGFALAHEPGLVVVLALEDAGLRMGYTTLEIGPEELSLCPELARHVASAVARVRREQEVRRLHAAERERSSEIERATQELRANQEQLLISEKMASLGRLAAGMANEMATPLDIVRTAFGHLEELAVRYEDELEQHGTTSTAHADIADEVETWIGRASGAAAKVAGFVQGIKVQTRDLSRKEFARFDAVSVVKDTLLLLNHAFQQANCGLSFETPGGPIDLYGSPGRLAQVLTNLISNAIDASRPKGGGRVFVRLSASESEVLLEVEDEGVGIRSEDLPRIFDPLFTTKAFGQGTGLGLSIVQNVVVGEFNGSVTAESVVGKGTTLLVRLPPPPSTAPDISA